VTATDFATLKRRATAMPDGPEALRLSWLQARAIGSPLKCHLDLISRYLDRGHSIREIDTYIQEQLGSALEALDRAERSGTIPPRRLRGLKETIELAVSALRARPKGGSTSSIVVHALETAARLNEDAAAAS